jgi:hypothetical protein
MQDHGAVPHGAMQFNHDAVPYGAMQKRSDCEIFSDLIYFALKFPKRVNYSYFHAFGTLYLFDMSLHCID